MTDAEPLPNPFEMVPLDLTPELTFEIPGTKRTLGVTFGYPGGEDISTLQDVREATIIYLKEGMGYFFGLVGEEFPLSTDLLVGFTLAERPYFKGQGAMLKIPIRAIRDSFSDPKMKFWVQSAVIHEIVHQQTDDEDFPMFAELLYMAEQGQGWRFKGLLRNFEGGNLKKEYVTGLEKIKKWAGFKTAEELLTKFPSLDIHILRETFKDELTKSLSDN